MLSATVATRRPDLRTIWHRQSAPPLLHPLLAASIRWAGPRAGVSAQFRSLSRTLDDQDA